jgi:phage terminase large subunit-like protein
MASTEAMRVRLRELRSEYPVAQARDERTKRPMLGPAYAFDRIAFGESAEMLEGDGLNMVDVPMTAAVMGPPSTLAYELITTGRLVHDDDPVLAEHIANTTAVLTDRGMKVTRSKHGSTRPNVAAVAMVRAVAMAMQEAPPPRRPVLVMGR